MKANCHIEEQKKHSESGIIHDSLLYLIKIFLDVYCENTKMVIAVYDSNGKNSWCGCEENFSPLCAYIRSDPFLWKLCEQDHARRTSSDYFPDKMDSKQDCCLWGLWNISFPISQENTFYGALITGQRKLSSLQHEIEGNEKFDRIINHLIGKNMINNEQAEALKKCYEKTEIIDSFSKEHIKTLSEIRGKLIYIVQDLLKRIKRISLLRHEIHQPNMTVTGNLSEAADKLKILKEKATKCKDKLCASDIDHIIDIINYSIGNAKLFSAIIENIISTLNLEPIKLHIERCNIFDLLKNAMQMFEEPADRKLVCFNEIKTKNIDNPFLECDKSRITRVFTNIYHNAVKYSFYGRRDTKIRYIETFCEGTKGFFVIEVSNYGIGILDDELCKVFDEGYRGKLSSDRHRTGSGFGLYQVKQIVEAHGGKVMIDSRRQTSSSNYGPYLTKISILLPYIQEDINSQAN